LNFGLSPDFIIIIIINDIYRAQTSPRSKCAKSAVARSQLALSLRFCSANRWAKG